MEQILRFVLGIASIFVVMIPARYRQWWPIQSEAQLRAPAIASGLIEVFVGAPGTTAYVAFSIGAAQTGLGVGSLILNPFIIFPFLLAEGIVRTLAAMARFEEFRAQPPRYIRRRLCKY